MADRFPISGKAEAPTYTCEMCGNTYEMEIPDEKARDEGSRLFPDVKPEDMAVVCDDCWKGMGFNTCTGNHTWGRCDRDDCDFVGGSS